MTFEKCSVCDRDNFLFPLNKCPTCYKRACDRCSTRRTGRIFCSKQCATEFFYGFENDSYLEPVSFRRAGAKY